jgi:AraC-like DNA-binding protein
MINMVQTLLRDMDQLHPISYDAVADGLVSILVAGLRTLDGTEPSPSSTLGAYHLQRIRRYVIDHLGDPELTVQRMAGALQMSLSNVYRSFDEQGATLADWIWTQRLERCRRDLANPMLANQSIIQIGCRWGFTDASHMSRSFKRAFGMAPREFRKRALSRTEGEREG